jgi:hypothetical protein
MFSRELAETLANADISTDRHGVIVNRDGKAIAGRATTCMRSSTVMPNRATGPPPTTAVCSPKPAHAVSATSFARHLRLQAEHQPLPNSAPLPDQHVVTHLGQAAGHPFRRER